MSALSQSAASQERRSAIRRRTLLAGKIAYDGGAVSMDCTIRNLSETGALIRLPAPLPLPRRLQLLCAHEQAAFDAEVIWRNDLHVGLRLHQRFNLEAASSLAASLRRIWIEMQPRRSD